MSSELDRVEPTLQDLDLFGRLTDYFMQMEYNLKSGLGWLIFNAAGNRGRRIDALVVDGFRRTDVPLAWQHVPWRDFSLNAYMVQVELQAIEEAGNQLAGRARKEFEIATRVSRDSMVRMVAADVLILSGVRPAHRHELELLEQTIERRHNLKAPTVFITPAMPHELAIEFSRVVPDQPVWDRMFDRLYRRSLVAV